MDTCWREGKVTVGRELGAYPKRSAAMTGYRAIDTQFVFILYKPVGNGNHIR
jgi:hypothetical protein